MKVEIWKENLRKQKDQIKDMLTEFRSDILDGQDKIYKELKDFREEQSSHSPPSLML